MSAAAQPKTALPNFKEAKQVAENGTVSKHYPMTQRQMLRVLTFTGQSSWTPEAIAGIVFGILMFLLGVIAVWQTRNQKLILIGDIESNLRLPVMPCTLAIEIDTSLWIPPYEPPHDLVCIADPPDYYANAHGRVYGAQDPKKPAPKPQPLPKPPQPRDGYEVDIDMANATPNNKNYPAWSLKGQESKKPAPAPKPKPSPKPMPPQPRDGYEVEIDLADAAPETNSQHAWSFGDKEPKKPAPKPKPMPPQPLDGYAARPDLVSLIPQYQDPLSTKAQTLVSLTPQYQADQFLEKPQHPDKARGLYRWLVSLIGQKAGGPSSKGDQRLLLV